MQDGGTVSLGEVGLGKRKGKVKSAHVWLGPSETRLPLPAASFEWKCRWSIY